nr:immunoglobulin heavy chain junction region [Mus musculus]MBK4186785.1 immunoglobulin heavy chain junction region [Mus musculus]
CARSGWDLYYAMDYW